MKVKRFEEGGSFTELGGSMDIVGGVVKGIYGVKQLRDANREYDRAKAAAPSLDTPAQFYDNYRNAYDSELARIEMDAIQGNVATSVQALQGAGGRALVGGLGAAVATSQSAQNKMLNQERQARMVAGSQLAQAESQSIARKEARSQQELQQAQAAAAAARQNIVGGITDVATGALAGGLTPFVAGAKKAGKFLADTPGKFSDFMTNREIKKTRKAIGYGETNENMQNFILNQNQYIQDVAKSWQNHGLKDIGTKGKYGDGFERPAMSSVLENVDRSAMMQAQLASEARASAVAVSDQTSQYSGVGGAMAFNGQGYGILGGTAAVVGNTLGGAGGSFQGGSNAIDYNLQQIQATPYNPNGFIDPVTGQFVSSPNNGAGADFGIKSIPGTYKQGGMMTKGNFSHESNPIDIVQDGVKVGEATGGEYILNPEQAAKVKKESSYARRLFKQFEKKAKKK